MPERIFLLSPAKFGGPRTSRLLREEAEFDLSVRLRNGNATLGEIYSFISGLYFRGKLTYATAFGAPPEGLGSAMVITPGLGLLSPDRMVTEPEFRQIGSIPVEETDPAFREPLIASAQDLLRRAGQHCEFVLLGSIATNKYVDPLRQVLGDRLLFPREFVGRGDMSRGGLLLRSARGGQELTYVRIPGSVRRGQRPPKLTPLP